MGVLAAAISLLLATPSAAGGQAAAALERRLDELSGRLKRQNALYERESLALLGAISSLEHSPPGTKEAKAAEKEVARLGQMYPNAAIFLEMTVLARRLRIYKETGELPAGIPDSRAILAVLEHPWKDAARLADLELGLPKLIRQLERYDRLALPAARMAGQWWRETLPAIPPKQERGAPALRAPALERDAGRGKTEIDPVPELIVQLSSPDSRRRALSADELGARGAGAARAVPALRRALSDPDPRVRASAVLALGCIGQLAPEVVEDIRRARLDKNEDVRFSARRALELLRPR